VGHSSNPEDFLSHRLRQGKRRVLSVSPLKKIHIVEFPNRLTYLFVQIGFHSSPLKRIFLKYQIVKTTPLSF